MKKTILILGAFLGVALLTLGLVGYGYAQTQTPDVPGFWAGGRGPQLVGSGLGLAGLHPDRTGPLHEYIIAAVAEALDMSVEDLEARRDAGDTLVDIAIERGLTVEEFTNLMTDALTQAVENALQDEVITQDQADRIQEGLENGLFRFGFRGPRRGFGLGPRLKDGPLQEYLLPALAEALDLNPEELQTRLDDGETPREIAESQGMTLEEFQTALEDARDSALEQAVADGVITQEQADRIAERGLRGLRGPGCRGGFGPNGNGGNGNGGNGNGSNDSSGSGLRFQGQQDA